MKTDNNIKKRRLEWNDLKEIVEFKNFLSHFDFDIHWPYISVFRLHNAKSFWTCSN